MALQPLCSYFNSSFSYPKETLFECIYHSIQKGDLGRLTNLCNEEMCLKELSMNGKPLIEIALLECKKNLAGVIELLIQHGADPHGRTHDGNSFIYLAAKKNCLSSDQNRLDPRKEEIFIELIDIFHHAGVDIEKEEYFSSSEEKSPLSEFAFVSNCLELLKKILEIQAKKNDYFEGTHAVKGYNKISVRQFIRSVISNSKAPKEMLGFLIRIGADPSLLLRWVIKIPNEDLKDQEGSNPRWLSYETLRKIYKKTVHFFGKNGNHCQESNRKKELINYLIEKRADINCTYLTIDNIRATVLSESFYFSTPDLCNFLIDKGATLGESQGIAQRPELPLVFSVKQDLALLEKWHPIYRKYAIKQAREEFFSFLLARVEPGHLLYNFPMEMIELIWQKLVASRLPILDEAYTNRNK